MKKIVLQPCGKWFAAAIALLPALAIVCAAPVNAQTMANGKAAPHLPGSVLLFPPTVNGANGAPVAVTPQITEAQEIVTDSLRRFLSKGGVGVVVYSGRSPSVVRALQETQGLKPEEAVRGPFDDPRIAKKLAEIMNATEYVTASIDNYVFDAKSRRVTYNLSVFRNGADGTALASFAQKAVGEAPADVALPLVEGSAVARAADLVADQTVRSIYPDTVVMLNPPPAPVKKSRPRAPLAWILPAAAVVGLLIIPR